MKKHLLLLVAFVSLAVGAVACNSKASSSEDSRVEEFCDLLRDCTKKIDAVSSSYEFNSISEEFDKDAEEYKDDDTKLSKSEKKELVDAFADLAMSMTYKQSELMGQSLGDIDRTEFKKKSVEEIERLTSDCESISDYIAVFEEIGNGGSAAAPAYESASTTAAAFADLINDYAIKVGAANSEAQVDAIGEKFEQDCSRFENDNSYLSSAEKAEIIEALTGLITSMGCKYAEFEGTKVDVETQSLIESYSRNSIEQVTANCSSISEIITAIENMAD